jgi:hypothetical protein
LPDPLNDTLSEIEPDSSDIVFFHSYAPLADVMEQVAEL